MLTHEQVKLRQRDVEIAKLRTENERLTEKIKEIKIGIINLARGLASEMRYVQKTALLKMVNELEQNEV